MDEHRAIELCVKHRDPVGFEFLVAKYRREAFFHAYAILGSQEDAFDACQDSFARAFAAIPGLEQLPNFYPWFYRILRNRCLNMIERRKTSDRFARSERLDPDRGVEFEDPAAVLEEQDEKRRIDATLGSLGPLHREILTLKYLQGHSYDEISLLLGVPRGTVMSRLYNARSAFREAYIRQDPAAKHSPEKIT
jgi:RNA polymerase sigma-70 factor, ECF subfamily